MMVVAVLAKVLGKVANPLGQEGNLHVGGACVLRVDPVLFDQAGLLLPLHNSSVCISLLRSEYNMTTIEK